MTTLLDAPSSPPNGTRTPAQSVPDSAHRADRNVVIVERLRDLSLTRTTELRYPGQWLTWLLLHGYSVADDDITALGMQKHSMHNTRTQLRAAGYEIARNADHRWAITTVPPGQYVQHRRSTTLPPAPSSLRDPSNPSPPRRKTAKASTAGSHSRDTRKGPTPAAVPSIEIPRLSESLTVRMLIDDPEGPVAELRATDGRTFLVRLLLTPES